MANRIEDSREFKIAHERVLKEKASQDKALHETPPFNHREISSGISFNLGFSSTQEMNETIEKNPDVFLEISRFAIKNCVSYEEAENQLREITDPELIPNIKKYQNLKARTKEHAKEPGPQRVYVNPHKPRNNRMTRDKLNFLGQLWLQKGISSKTKNSEPATPLDEYPDITR